MEEWRPVVGYEGRYEVSDEGRVRSYCTAGHGGCGLRLVPRARKPVVDPWGYVHFVLGHGAGPRGTHKAHHLVLEAFVGPRPAGCEARHLNGNKLDNRLDNLTWGSHIENILDKKRHGTFNAPPRKCGASNGNARLTDLDAMHIRQLHASGLSQREIGRMYGIDHSTAGSIVRGRTWKQEAASDAETFPVPSGA